MQFLKNVVTIVIDEGKERGSGGRRREATGEVRGRRTTGNLKLARALRFGFATT